MDQAEKEYQMTSKACVDANLKMNALQNELELVLKSVTEETVQFEDVKLFIDEHTVQLKKEEKEIFNLYQATSTAVKTLSRIAEDDSTTTAKI